MNFLIQIRGEFILLLAMSWKSFLLGIGLAALCRWLLRPSWVERRLGGAQGSVATAALAGALLPGCAMSAIPIAAELRAKGARTGTVAAFLMIAPLLSPHTVALSFAMLGWRITFARVVLPFIFTLIIGSWLNRRSAPAPFLPVESPRQTACHGSRGCEDDPVAKEATAPWFAAVTGFLRESIWPLLPYFFGGLLVAAVAAALVPPDLMKHHGGGPAAYAVALAAGIPLYVCDGGEVPLTLALLNMGVAPGPAFTFLLGSVGTCFATIAAAPRIIGRFAAAAYVAGTAILALGGGLLVGLWLR